MDATTGIEQSHKIASKDVSPESSENVGEFWIEWNSNLSEIEDNEYKFNPSTIMVDQSKANINSIAAAYGE